MERINRILEIFWLVIAIVCAFLSIFYIYKEGFQTGKYYLFLPAIALGMYLLRRVLRKKLEKNQALGEHKK